MNTSTLLLHNAVRAGFLVYERNRRKFLRMAGVAPSADLRAYGLNLCQLAGKSPIEEGRKDPPSRAREGVM